MNPLELPEIVAMVLDRLPKRDVFTCLLVCRGWCAEANRSVRWPATKIAPTECIHMYPRQCSPMGLYFGGSEVIYKVKNPATIHKWVSCNLDECVLFSLKSTDSRLTSDTCMFVPRDKVKDRISRYVTRADPGACEIYISNDALAHKFFCNIADMTNAEVLRAIATSGGVLYYSVTPSLLQRFVDDL